MKRIAFVLTIFVGISLNVNAQDPNILIGLGSPAYGVKVKLNYPGQTTGWARAFSFTNEDDTQQFIMYGAKGGISNGVASLDYGYIGKEYNDTYMAFRPTGYVGVGTVDPTSFLHINAKSGHYANDGSKSTFKLSYSNTVYANHFIGTSWNYFIDNPYSGSSQGGIHFRTAGSKRMTVAKDGNVGIGTDSPTAKLHVAGAIRHTNVLSSQGVNYSSVWMKFDEHQYGNSLILGGGGLTAVGGGESANHVKNNVGAGTETLYLSSDRGIKIVTNLQSGWGARVDALDISDNGNIGIGDSTPDEKLTVAGTVKSQEVIVEATAGADFVFEEDYDLPTLTDIEKFVKANKHLEGIPSAKEMVDNGVKVGELQIKLLQKIEELTLHMIQLKKENDQLKTDLKELKNKEKQN